MVAWRDHNPELLVAAITTRELATVESAAKDAEHYNGACRGRNIGGFRERRDCCLRTRLL
jgi:hypothetical protein